MSTNYAFENLLRSPWELLVAFAAFNFGILCILHHEWMLLTINAGIAISIPFFMLFLLRFFQGIRIWLYRKRLLVLRSFFMSITEIPKLKKAIYIGRGFRWLSVHRQRLSLFSLVDNQKFLQESTIYKWLRKFLPFRLKRPDIGGKPWIHGVGTDKETDVHLTEESRKGNAVVFGETGVGKSQTESLLVAQDIYKGQGVLVIDPKGDLSLLQNIYLACAASNRLNNLYIVHAGIPDLSAKYNPLDNYVNVSEVATRITSAISAHGEGKQFQDFAWKFLNITATCLEEMGEPITYKSLAFFVTKPRQLLLAYCDKILPKKDPNYLDKLDQIIRESQQIDKHGNSLPPMKREDAARIYVASYIEETISKGEHKALHDSIIADLSHAADIGEEYYGKITACLGPVFDKINKTSAGNVFSWENSYGLPAINLEGIIKRKQVVYVCLDSQSNKAMAEAVGQAIIADLVSLCGRLYKEIPNLERLLYLHADEFSEIVQDDFINLLNKARGAGVRVTAYTQTVNDLGVAFGASHDKPKMLLGNFSNMVMMRVGNLDTARIFTECLEEVKTRSTTPSTMSNDRPDGQNGDLFTSYNTDTINEQRTKIILENDLFSLPKGQAMMLTNGGELYKTRIPLLKTEHHVPESFESLMSEVNLCRT
jgi:conjugative coupling factor TraD (TOL family)